MAAHPLNDDAATTPRQQLVRPWIWALLAAVLTLATYVPALAGEFVWDDTSLIGPSTGGEAKRPFTDYFTKPFWGPSGISPQMNLYYRPLVAVSYDIDRSIHGLNSAGFRITNYAFHLANVVLLFSLLMRLGTSGMTAALMSATWGVLPRLSESVAWISGRTDVFAATGVLAALLVWGDRRRRMALAATFLTMGLFCKETAIAGVVAVLFLEFSQSAAGNRRRTLTRAACYLSPALAWFVLKTRVSGALPSGFGHQTTSTRILTFFEAIGRYLCMVLDWLHPRAEIGVMGEPSSPLAGLGMVAFVALGTFLFWLWPRSSNWSRAFLLGALAAIAPVLHVVQLTLDVNAADRFLYIPLAFLVLVIGASSSSKHSRITQSVFVLVLLSSIPVTVGRAKIWTDPVTLWTDEYRKSEGRCRTCRRELTRIQADAGDFAPALRMIQTLMSDTLPQRNTPALVALDMAVLYSKLGDYTRANRLLLMLVGDQPTIPSFWRELAAAQAARFDFDAAESSAKHALTLMPSYEKAQIAVRLIEKLRVDALKLNDPATSDIERANFYTTSGRISDAEPLWLKILANSASPDEVENAFEFIANLGTSAAASLALEQHGQRLRAYPLLATQIHEKHALHAQLARLQLLK